MTPTLWIALLFVAGYRLLWPGDASFVSDEAMLIDRAWQIVQTGEIPASGLTGSLGTHYGPFAIYVYALFLLVTTSLPTLVSLKVLFVTAATVWAIHRFSKIETFGRFGWIALLSPYLWFYSRDLWDNSFLIPLTAISFVSFLQFQKNEKLSSFAASFLTACLAIITHLMALPLLGAIAFVTLMNHRGFAKRHWGALLAIGLVGFLICLPYAMSLVGIPSPERGSIRIATAFFPFYGARFFSALGFQYILGGNWVTELSQFGATPFIWVLYVLSGIGYLLSWAGLYIAAKNWRRHAFPLTVFLFSWAMLCFSGRVSHPHYYNGYWFAMLYFLCLGISQTLERTWTKRATLSWAFSLAVFFFVIPLFVHNNQGSRAFRYGPTLNNLVSVGETLRKFAPESEISSETTNAQLFFHTIAFLRDFPTGPAKNSPKEKLAIRYADEKGGAIEVVPASD